MSDYTKVRSQISNLELDVAGSSLEILTTINQLVNNRSTLNEGRDLIIRVLAKLSLFEECEKKFIFSLVRTVGLFPYVSEHLNALSIADRLAYEMHRATELGDQVVFHSLQSRVYNLLMDGNNVILSAATSVGKSLIVDAIVASRRFRKIVVVVPTIALIDETRRRLNRKFSEFCSVITHPSQQLDEERTNIYVLTQERVLQRKDLGEVEFFVIDEFYKIDLSSEKDAGRAIDLNLAFHKLSREGAQFYLLGPNIRAIHGLANYQFMFVPSDFSTVAVDVIQFGLPTRGSARQEKLIELCNEISSPTIIYCQSPASANFVANLLIDKSSLEVNEYTKEVALWLANNYHPDWDVCKAIKYGIGVHHGGVPRALQQYFIKLFNEQKIRYLVCTSTIIEGVNTSAENVIIYDRRKDSAVFDYFTYKNIAGRAGRMGRYFVGKVYMLESAPPVTDLDVSFPIGIQDVNSPLSLLMELDHESLSDLSKERLDKAYKNHLIKKETIAANRYISVDLQMQIAERIFSNVRYYYSGLSWENIPAAAELEMVCELVFEFLEGHLLKDYNIHSGAALAWHINSLRMNSGVREYLRATIKGRREDQSPSSAINSSLRFIRNVVSHRLPKDLMAISRIQADVFSGLGKEPGDFSFFCSQLENVFKDPLLVALDEYGIPIQVAEKISPMILPADDLGTVIKKLKKISPKNMHLGDLEKQLLTSAIADL